MYELYACISNFKCLFTYALPFLAAGKRSSLSAAKQLACSIVYTIWYWWSLHSINDRGRHCIYRCAKTREQAWDMRRGGRVGLEGKVCGFKLHSSTWWLYNGTLKWYSQSFHPVTTTATVLQPGDTSVMKYSFIQISHVDVPLTRTTQPGHPFVGRRNEYHPNAYNAPPDTLAAFRGLLLRGRRIGEKEK